MSFSENRKMMWIPLFHLSLIIGMISTAYREQRLSVIDGNGFFSGLIGPTPSFANYAKEIDNANMTNLDGNGTNNHDFVFGVKGPKDHLLLRTTVYKRPKIWSQVVGKEITFPPTRSPFKVTIRQVKVHDKGVNGTGGFVKITRGGIGKNSVTILFTSHENMPIHFGLEIYGTRN